jgi:plastocyanin
MLVLACAFAGCTSSKIIPPPTETTARNVTIGDSGYSPSPIQVKIGTTVTWLNTGNYQHTVTSNFAPGDPFNSPSLATGGSYQHTFTQPGTYPYHDALNHALTGIVQVLE